MSPPKAPGFGEMRPAALLRLLRRELGYTFVRQAGSHRVLEAAGRPRLVFAFHDSQTIGPALVRTILVRDVGLTRDEAKELVRRA